MEKGGRLDLKGRRAGTAPVLSENLAILVRETIRVIILSNALYSVTISSYAHIFQPSLVFLDLGPYFIHLTSMEYR